MSERFNCYLVSIFGDDYAMVNAREYGINKAVGEYLDAKNKGDKYLKILRSHWNEDNGFQLSCKLYEFSTEKDRNNAIDMINLFPQDYDQSKQEGAEVIIEEDIVLRKCDYQLYCDFYCDKSYHFYDSSPHKTEEECESFYNQENPKESNRTKQIRDAKEWAQIQDGSYSGDD